MPHCNLLVRVIQLDRELGRKDGLWWRWDGSVHSGLLRQRGWLRPFWDEQHLGVQDVGCVSIVKRSGVSISGSILFRVKMSERVGRFELGAMLGEEKGRGVFGFLFGRFDEEGYNVSTRE